jgi:hypothetical protein
MPKVEETGRKYKLTNIIEDDKECLSHADDESLRVLKRNEQSGALPVNESNLSEEALNKCDTQPLNQNHFSKMFEKRIEEIPSIV